jgi:DNA-binding SARP family transcriptional activator/pimeloyl-ACP methyl ester carboxylesterase
MVRLYLFGELRLDVAGRSIELPASRKARLLLALVAFERRVHGRSELAGRLWPDVAEASARASLRTELSKLRAALATDAGSVLEVDDGGVSLAAGVWTDVGEAERFLAERDPEAALELCARHLLSGFDDDDVHEWRDRLHRRLLDGFETAAASAEAAGRQQDALRLTRRWAELEPLSEVPHRELIRRHAAGGDRGSALATYERFRARLADELQIVPSVATRALIDEIRSDDQAAAGIARRGTDERHRSRSGAQRSAVRYARSGGLSIAYQSFGEGDRDLVIVPGWASNLDVVWEFPPLGSMFAEFGAMARCVVFDKRGTGLSDRTLGFGSLEERAEDIRAVMDAAEIERATVFGYSESAALALVFAAAHPRRVDSLVLYSAYARLPSGPDNPDGFPPQLVEAFVQRISSDWGTGAISPFSFAGVPQTPAAQQLLARWERSLCTPTMAAHIIRRNADIDIRPLLPTIETPALVLHSSGDPLCPAALGRHIAEQLPRGRYQEHDAAYHLPWRGEDAWFLEPIERHLTGRQPLPRPPTRLLATVLATEFVVPSDRGRFQQLLDTAISRFGGERITTTTSGSVAIFDSPSSAIACAAAICHTIQQQGISAKAGIHTGEIEQHEHAASGFAIELALRLAHLAIPNRVMVSRTVRDLTIGSSLQFTDHGPQHLEELGQWELFVLVPGQAEA